MVYTRIIIIIIVELLFPYAMRREQLEMVIRRNTIRWGDLDEKLYGETQRLEDISHRVMSE